MDLVLENGSETDVIDEEIQDLRMKKILKEKEFACLYDNIEGEKAENEKKISSLRAKIAKLREVYAECLRGDEKVIHDVFRKRGKREMLGMPRSIISAIQGLDEKLSKQFHELDGLVHIRRQRVKKLNTLTDEITDLENLGDTAYEANLMRVINVRANEVEKVKVKVETACQITRSYKKIRDLLDKEVHSFPKKIAALEKDLKREKNERLDIWKSYQYALHHQDINQTELTDLEKKAYVERRQRDLLLTKTRIEVENKLGEQQSGGKKGTETSKPKMAVPFGLSSTLFEKSHYGSDERLAKQSARQIHILNLVRAFDIIKDAIMVSDIDEIVRRFEEQNRTHQHLREQAETLFERLNLMNEELAGIAELQEKSKYSHGTQFCAAKTEIDRMYQRTLDLENQLEELQSKVNAAQNLMMSVKTAVMTLFEKTSSFKLKPPFHNYSTGDPFVDLKVCQERLERIQEDLAKITDQRVIYCCLGRDRRYNFMAFVNDRLPSESDRFLTDMEDPGEMYHEDLPDRPDCMSNEDVKTRSTKIIDLATNRSKRKK